MIRKLLFSLLGLLFLASGNVFAQELPIFPYKLSPAERSNVLSKKQQGGAESVKIPYLPTNFVCRQDVIDLWNNETRDSIFSLMNAPLYAGGTFSVTPLTTGLTVVANTGELKVTGQPGKEVHPGVYTINYEYGSVGMEVFFFAPEDRNATVDLWKKGPFLESDLSNSFMIDGTEYIYVSNNGQGLYVEMPINKDDVLKTWAGSNLSSDGEENPTSGGGVATYPNVMREFYNDVVVPFGFEGDNEIISRVVFLESINGGSISFDNILAGEIPEDPDPDANFAKWKGRIRSDNFDGTVNTTGTNDVHPISHVAFSDNGNLFFINETQDEGGGINDVSDKLYFIPTLQILRMAGSTNNPVNPASINGIGDDGNLLNSRPIQIVDTDGVTNLEVGLGDLVIKNTSPLDNADFEAYVNGFGLPLDATDQGIWGDDWLGALEPAGSASKVNSSYSLDENWEFYFTSTESEFGNPGYDANDASTWYKTTTLYKAKLDLSDVANPKLVVQEKFPLDIGAPVTGLGIDQGGCLYFIAGYTPFALVKIYGWGGSCLAPANITAPFVVIDKPEKVDAQMCLTATNYDLTATVPNYLKTATGYIHPKGEPYNPSSTDVAYQPDLKEIFDITYTDDSDVAVNDPTAVGIGIYRVWVKQKDNGNPGLNNGLFDLQGQCVEGELGWFYEVEITVAPALIPNQINPSSETVEVCLTETFDLQSTTAWYDPNVYEITYFESDGVTVVADVNAVLAGDYKISIKDICSGNIVVFPYIIKLKTSVVTDNIIPASKTVEVCFGDTYELNTTTANYDSNNYTFEYFESDGTTPVVDATAVPAGDYFISVTDVCTGSSETYPFEVTQTPYLVIDFTYPVSSCGASTITPTVISGDSSIGEFKFQIKGQTGSWTTIISPATINTSTGIISNPVAGTTYEVRYFVSDTGCGTFEKIVDVVVNDNVSNLDPSDISQVNDIGLCSALVELVKPDVSSGCATINDLTITFNSTSDVLDPATTNNYTFSVGVSTVNYNVTDAGGNSIPFEYTVTITDEEIPVITNIPANITVDSSYPVCETIATWTEPTITDNCTSGIVSVITGVDASDNAITVTNGGTFPFGVNTITYTATDDAGNYSEESFTITVNDSNPPIIDLATLPSDITQCDPNIDLEEVEITLSCGGGIVTNSFTSNGGDASGVYPYGQTTVVTYTVTDNNGTVTDTKSFNVTIHPQISVDIDGPSTVDDGYEFEITSIVTPSGAATSYSWTAISGDVTFVRGTEIYAEATIIIEGDATIQLEVASAEGCIATDQISITSSGDCNIPNVITPNGDGINDLFIVPCLDSYENNHIRIYDRWGQTVFETDNYQNNWNGTNGNGDNLSGTFYYTFTSTNKPTKSGYVVVVR